MRNTSFSWLLILLLFNGCFGLARKDHLVGRYYLIAADINDDTNLSFETNNGGYVGIVQANVIEVGYNDQYIIVKQEPNPTIELIRYYIVPIYKKFTYFPEKGVIGPLSLEGFNQKRKELKIADSLKFTRR